MKKIYSLGKIALLSSLILFLAGNSENESLKPMRIAEESFDSHLEQLANKARESRIFKKIRDTQNIDRYNISTQDYNFDLVFKNGELYFWAYQGKVPGSGKDVFINDFQDKPGIETYLEEEDIKDAQPGKDAATKRSKAEIYKNCLEILRKINSDI